MGEVARAKKGGKAPTSRDAGRVSHLRVKMWMLLTGTAAPAEVSFACNLDRPVRRS